MLPQQVIFSVFAALISQGNMISALPQGSKNYARSEHINGQSTRDMIEARASTPVIKDSELATRSNDLSQGNKAIFPRVDPVAVIGLVAALTTGATGAGVKIYADQSARGDAAAATPKEERTFLQKVLVGLRRENPTLSDAQIELAVQDALDRMAEDGGRIVAVPTDDTTQSAGGTNYYTPGA